MRKTLPIVLVAVVVLAGCAGLGGQATDTTVGPDGTATTTGAETPAAMQNASAVKTDAVAALDAVETYRVDANLTSEVGGNLNQRVVVTTDGTFDRVAREMAVNQTQSAQGFSTTNRQILVNQTLYQYSPQFAQQFDSNWVTMDLSGDFSSTWDGMDTLTRQRDLLAMSNVTLDGTTSVAGQQVYVLQATPDVEEYEDLSQSLMGARPNVSDVSATFYVSTETSRLVASNLTIQATETVNGQQVAVDQQISLQFSDYDAPADIVLPEEARETAVDLDNRSGVQS